jgi:hypothetical protein
VNVRYRWVLDGDAYAALVALPRAKRREFERAFDRLATDPFTPPSFSFDGPDDTPLSACFVRDRMIVFHVDHAVKRVYILEVSEAP